MFEITLSEFSHSVQTYLPDAAVDDVVIVKNGEPYIKIIAGTQNATARRKTESSHPISKQLLGIAAGLNMSLDEIKGERLSKYERTH